MCNILELLILTLEGHFSIQFKDSNVVSEVGIVVWMVDFFND